MNIPLRTDIFGEPTKIKLTLSELYQLDTKRPYPIPQLCPCCSRQMTPILNRRCENCNDLVCGRCIILNHRQRRPIRVDTAWITGDTNTGTNTPETGLITARMETEVRNICRRCAAIGIWENENRP